MGYRLNCLDEPIFIAVLKPLLTEFGIHHRLESCAPYYVLLKPWFKRMAWPKPLLTKFDIHLRLENCVFFIELRLLNLGYCGKKSINL